MPRISGGEGIGLETAQLAGVWQRLFDFVRGGLPVGADHQGDAVADAGAGGDEPGC